MFEPDSDGVFQTIYPTFGRRVVALAAYYGLAVVLVWLAFSSSLGVFAVILLIGLGIFILLTAESVRRSTRYGVKLTTQGLADTSGREIVTWDEIARIDKGTFAVKPSNGFSIVLKEAGPRSWSPGLWWRMRRRVGIGGVLAGPQTRTMAEQMALLLPDYQTGGDA